MDRPLQQGAQYQQQNKMEEDNDTKCQVKKEEIDEEKVPEIKLRQPIKSEENVVATVRWFLLISFEY